MSHQGPSSKGEWPYCFSSIGSFCSRLHIIGTRKNCHIFHKNRHYRALKAWFDDLRYQEELSHFPHSLRDRSCETWSKSVYQSVRRSKCSSDNYCDSYWYGQQFLLKGQNIAKAQTRSKFYVACTRAKHSVVFALKNPKETELFKQVELNLAGEKIPAFKYYNR